jgi:outer membrane receptor for ferrienterochelin and colicins
MKSRHSCVIASKGIKAFLFLCFQCSFFLFNSSLKAQIHLIDSEDSSKIVNAKIHLTHSKQNYYSNSKGIVTVNVADKMFHLSVTHQDYDTLIGIFKHNSILYLKRKSKQYKTFVFTNVSGTKTELKDVLANISVIPSEKIVETGSQNLADVLKYEPNIEITQDPSLGTSLTLNGISGQNVKILKNGAQLSGDMNGSIDLSQVNVGNIEQIEIVEGPMSLLYGSNALGGTVNIISKNPQNQNEKQLKTYTESSGHYNQSLAWIQKIKKGSLQLNVGRNFFDGWNQNHRMVFENANEYADSSRYMLWKPKRQGFAEMNIHLPLSKNSHLKLNSDYLNEKIINKGLPMGPYFETALDDFYNTQRFNQSAEINVTNPVLRHNVFLNINYFRRTKNTYFNDLTDLSKSRLTSAENQDTTQIYSSQIRYISSYKKKSLSLNYGVDFQYESFIGKKVSSASNYIVNTAAVLVANYRLNRSLDLKTGVRQNINSTAKIPLIPSIMVSYAINKKSKLNASFSKGFRTPGIKELYLYFVDINHNIVGNENLKSESSNHLNLQYQYRNPISKTSQLHLQINSFKNIYTDMISLALKSGTEYTYINIGSVKNIGINSSLKYSLKHLEIQLKSSLLGTKNQLNLDSLQQYLFSNNWSMHTSIYLNASHSLKLNVLYNYFGKSPFIVLNEGKSQQMNVPSYQMMDLTINQIVRYKSMKLNLCFGVKNLMNVTNIQAGAFNSGVHSSGNQRIISNGRNLFLSTIFNF